MSQIINLENIRRVLPRIDLVGLMETGFVEYSRGHVVVPPVGELLFDDPPGDVHIKYGYIQGDEHYVIKIASGFYENPKFDLPSSQGLMLVFSSRTGVLEAVLLEEGHLTDLRTAAAGAVAAKHLAPSEVSCIGILGAGVQAELQLRALLPLFSCRRVRFWTHRPGRVDSFRQRLSDCELALEAVDDPAEVARECELIVTTTPSTTPLLWADDVMEGTHITAIGSDTAEKVELDPALVGTADLVVVDSLAQSESRGEVYRAVAAGMLERDRVVELGEVIERRPSARSNDELISICDLTGVAVQDILIAKAVLQEIAWERRP